MKKKDKNLEILTKLTNETTNKKKTPKTVYKEIEHTKFIDNPLNKLNYEKVEEYKESIKDVGLIEPLNAKPQDDGTFMLHSGHTRLRAIKELIADGDETYLFIPTIITQTKLADWKSKQMWLDSNKTRTLTTEEKKHMYEIAEEVYNEKKKLGLIPKGTVKREYLIEEHNISERVQREVTAERSKKKKPAVTPKTKKQPKKAPKIAKLSMKKAIAPLNKEVDEILNMIDQERITFENDLERERLLSAIQLIKNI